MQTRFKLTFKYFVNLIYKKYLIFFLGRRNLISSKLKAVSDQSRYLTINYIFFFIINYLQNKKNFNIFFFYKNLSFIHIFNLTNFFKFIKLFSIKDFFICYHYYNLTQLNKYFKKIKTIKKFKRKIFFREFRFEAKETYYK